MCFKRVSLAILTGLIFQLGSSTSFAQETANSVRMNAAPIHAEPFNKENWDLYWKLATGGRRFNDKTDDGVAATLATFAQIEWRITPELRFSSEARAVFNSQRTQQDILGDDFEDGLRMKEAVLLFEPFSMTTFGAGAINETRLRSPLLIGDRTFPGLFEQIHFGDKANGVGFELQQVVPTSKSFNSQRAEKEKLPMLNTATLAGAWTPTEVITIKPQFTYFQFSNLPSRVAVESAIYGNSIEPAGITNAKYKYAFEGTVMGLETDLHIGSNLTVMGGYQTLTNRKAPSAFNTGRLGSLGFKTRLGEMEIKPAYLVFYNESDTSPASYNEAKFGHNNREGWGARLELEFKRYGFNIRSEYYDADVVNSNANQSRQQYFSISLETTYAELL